MAIGAAVWIKKWRQTQGRFFFADWSPLDGSGIELPSVTKLVVSLQAPLHRTNLNMNRYEVSIRNHNQFNVVITNTFYLYIVFG